MTSTINFKNVFIAIGFGVFQASAQTTGVPVKQLAMSSVSPTGSIYAVLPDGSPKLVTIGTNLRLVAPPASDVTAPYTIVVDLPVIPPATTGTKVYNEVPVITAANKLQFNLAAVPVTGTLRVWNNGLRQTPGVDYTLTGTTITFVAYYVDMSNAKVICDYDRP